MSTPSSDFTGPLAGVKVLDLTRVLAGPFGTMMLADLGADVIKVEHPDRGDDTRHFGPPFVGDGHSTYFLSINRGKRSVAVDLKSPEGQAVVTRLVETCDILIENFRPGVLDRLGFGVAPCRELNPRLIYVSISGFGSEGLPEFVQAPGYDLLAQSLSGVASLTGPADAPPSKAGISVGDLVGGLYAVHGILAALYEREKTGLGCRVDISMLDGLVSLLTYQAAAFQLGGKVPSRRGNEHPSICPFETLRTRDAHLAVCCGNDRQFLRLLDVLKLPALAVDPRFETNPKRVQHRPTLIPLLEARFAEADASTWLARLQHAGVPCAPVQTVDQALAHPQLHARGMIGTVNHPTLGPIQQVACPVRINSRPAFNPRPAPGLGQHTAEILAELDLG